MVSVDADLSEPRWLPKSSREVMATKLHAFASLVVSSLEAKSSSRSRDQQQAQGRVRIADLSAEASQLSKANQTPSPTTLTGLLCGYPVLYVFEADCAPSPTPANSEATSSSNCLGMESLSLFSLSVVSTKPFTSTTPSTSTASPASTSHRKFAKRKGASSSVQKRVLRLCAFSVPSILRSSIPKTAGSTLGSASLSTTKPKSTGSKTGTAIAQGIQRLLSSPDRKKGGKRPKDDTDYSHNQGEAKSQSSSVVSKKQVDGQPPTGGNTALERFPLSGEDDRRLRYLMRFWNGTQQGTDSGAERWSADSLILSCNMVSLPRVGL